MAENELVVEIEIQNKKGLHARAAAAFVKTIENLDAEVEVEKSDQKVSGCSIMGLMMLAAAKGSFITIYARGNQAKEAVDSLQALINNKFGEE